MAKKKNSNSVDYDKATLEAMADATKGKPAGSFHIYIPENGSLVIDQSASKKTDANKSKKGSSKPKETKQKQYPLTRSGKATVWVMIICGIAMFIMGVLFLSIIELTRNTIVNAGTSLIVGLWFVIGGIITYNRLKKKVKQEESIWKKLSRSEKMSWILTIVTIILVVVIISVYYWRDLDPIWVGWTLVIILETRAVGYIIETLKSEQLETRSAKLYYVSQVIIFMVALIFIIHMLLGNNITPTMFEGDDTASMQWQFNFVMILVSASGVIGIMETIEDPNKSRTIRILMALLPIGSILLLNPSNANVVGGLISGQISSYNWFEGVYLSILRSPYAQFSLVLIVISALVIIIGKARGVRGTAQVTIGALGIAGVPMLITIFAFVGQVPAPDIFIELFGDGFANLIFAISYASIISLALALVGIFYEVVPSTGGDLL